MQTLHQRAKEVFIAALEREGAERFSFVGNACGDNMALRQEVESLLKFHDDEQSAAALEATAAPKTAGAVFTPGQLFAGRYRMITRIGAGGMGHVWRADDLVLDTAVALKLIYSTTGEGRQRILNEVRLARQITHPAICRVFDIGEAEGLIFYSMELVEGEDLAALLRRVGRLPSEKVSDIGHQLCAALSAAHERGVLHRDLKPANVLIDNDGFVRITDFGIALSRSAQDEDAGAGTPAYMAPEQRTPGAPLSERTDLYALGLVLYELLVGYRAISRTAAGIPPPRPSTFVSDVDPRLERVVMQAVSADPSDRPSSAAEMAAGLPQARSESQGRRAAISGMGVARPSRWLAGAGLAAVVGILAVASSFLVSPGGRPLTQQDTIVLAEFENASGDPVFDGALEVALAVALEQSPFLKVFPDERARETLRLMEHPPDERITRTVAREIARRERVKALLAGSISSLGRNYVLALEAVNAETGDVMAREQVEAASKEEVLSALGAATSRLREKLGESLASIQKFDVPLPRATTNSLEALHAYSLALDEGREVPRLEAIPYLKRAIELDPTFAMAHAQLSAVYTNTGQSSLAPEFSQKAFELRDRVSERERFFISWRYYRDAIQAWDKALELARSWTAAYPREAFAFNSLGAALLRLGQFEASVEPLRQAIRLDSKFIPAYSNLAASLIALDRVAEARQVLQQVFDQRLDFIGARRLSYLLAFLEDDRPAMARELEASTGVGETNAAFGWQAHTSAFAGQVKAAHEQFQRGIQMSHQGNFNEVAAQLTMEDAEMHAILGQCDDARSEVSTGLALNRDNGTLERASRTLALCGAATEAMSITHELEKRFPSATLTIDLAVPVTAAAIAIHRGDPARSLELLEPIRKYDHASFAEFWPAYLRGQAHLRTRNGAAASAEFRSIVDHPGEVPASVLYPLAHLGLARAASLTNDMAAARQAYQRFLSLWKEADDDLSLLQEARRELSQLR